VVERAREIEEQSSRTEEAENVFPERVFHYRNTLFHLGTRDTGHGTRARLGVPVNTPLEDLYRLQDRLRFLAARQRERDTIPAELIEVDREFRDKVDGVERLKSRRAEAEIERRRAHAELSEHRDKLRKYQTQLRAVGNQREYGAVLNEIDGVEKLVRAAEDRILNLDQELEKTAKELASREEMLPLETEQHEERLKDWRSAQRVINDELSSAQEEIRRLEAAMHPRDRAEFQRLMDKKGGLAIVLVSGVSCSACHVKVRPAALQALKAGREIVYCDSCKRILYWDMQRS
jgi:predicted  nucleic acid-binding Zn-ribbon protein